jgi:hypothetical protein
VPEEAKAERVVNSSTEPRKLTLRLFLAIAAWCALCYAIRRSIPPGSLGIFSGVVINPFFPVAVCLWYVRHLIRDDMDLRLDQNKFAPGSTLTDPNSPRALVAYDPVIKSYRERFGTSDTLFKRFVLFGWLMIAAWAATAIFWFVRLPSLPEH